MSDNAQPDEERPVERRAVIFLSGFYAPVLAALLCEAEIRFKHDPLQLEAVKALREHVERQVFAQYPEKHWLYNHD